MTKSIPFTFALTQTELKVFACSLMLVDHIGLVFFPNLVILRMIGRLAFPLFAWFFAYGYIRSKNWHKYFTRLLGFGLISQPLYAAMMGIPIYAGFNILLTFAFNLALLKFAHYSPRFKPLILIVGMVAETLLRFDYGWYSTAVIILLLSWLYNKDIRDYVFWQVSWAVLNLSTGLFITPYQPLAALSSFILDAVDMDSPTPPSTFQRLSFYIFFPLHIGVLLVVKNLL